MYSEKSFEKPYKTIKKSISCNVLDLFYSDSTQKTLGHSKGTPRPFGHSGHLDTQALKAF